MICRKRSLLLSARLATTMSVALCSVNGCMVAQARSRSNKATHHGRNQQRLADIALVACRSVPRQWLDPTGNVALGESGSTTRTIDRRTFTLGGLMFAASPAHPAKRFL